MSDEIKKIRSVYFIGIGGIGMSALARYFHSKGVKVSGYDRTESALTRELQQSGMDVHYSEEVELIPKDVQLVVYTPAVPKDHKELIYYQQNGYRVVKRSDVLQMITQSSFNICVSGTHGKTTITTLIAHILRDSDYGCTAFLGGVSVNYGTNFWLSESAGKERHGGRSTCVVEADEYDRSFLKLSPDIAVITAMDADHLDIYGTALEMEKAFIEFSRRLRQDGLLLTKSGLKREKDLHSAKHWTYSLQDKKAGAYAQNIRMMNGSYFFEIMIEGKTLKEMELHIGGLHNVENTVAAVAVAGFLGIEEEKIRKAVSSFKGVKRRFEYIIKKDRVVFIDDYAHHPEELRALIHGAKSLFSGQKCTVIFQPHLYTRTRDLADDFAEALDEADEVILLPVYPARELPIEGVSSEMILGKMKNEQKQVLSKEGLMNWLKKLSLSPGRKILITAGAGDIDRLVEPIKEIIEKK
ncbi:MAG: UDP-N-acetylmuramate--L-alanine ligase [Sphingobacteriales bacterium UTBCD1]|jgi:UDP-N-acetylmuramate--alanine ligase|nr:MAG: UDP-N-acetylmuramate--L-alanine ligase [Sphingobacteriales bacterium UTBCD1]